MQRNRRNGKYGGKQFCELVSVVNDGGRRLVMIAAPTSWGVHLEWRAGVPELGSQFGGAVYLHLSNHETGAEGTMLEAKKINLISLDQGLQKEYMSCDTDKSSVSLLLVDDETIGWFWTRGRS